MGSRTPEDKELIQSAPTLAQSAPGTATVGAGPKSDKTTYFGGQVVGGKYRLLRPLGEGGMAAVWVAHNEALDIHVAIKFIRAELQAEGLDERLLQEARAAARLGHPAIVRVSDFGKTDRGDPYIVMELLTGEDLAAAISRRGVLEPLRAVRTLLPIADALATAHSKRIVHRDLKPDNVFLAQTEDGRTQPKLVDFGIAKLEREDSQRITQLGAAMGSPAYMSPEQARGLDVDPRTDVWSMCVVLYEVLTKTLPFQGPNYTALVCAILERPPKPIMELGVPDPELWSIVARGLEKDPEKRWASMRDLGAALARWAIARGASDDISGRSLMSSWIERPPDSLPAGTPVSMPSIPDIGASLGSQGEGAMSATQLSATVSGDGKRRGISPIWLASGVGALLLLGVVAVVVVLSSSGARTGSNAPSAEPVIEVTTPQPSAQPTEAPTATVKVEPAVEPSAKPDESATAATAKPTAKPTARPSVSPKPTPKPTAKPTEKPAASTTKPTKKPDLTIKTDL